MIRWEVAFLNARLDEDEHEAASHAGPPGLRARQRREVEAKRAILRMAGPDRYSEWDDVTMGAVIEHLAAVYSDHPAYRQGWKP